MNPETLILAALAAPGFWELLKLIVEKIHEFTTGKKKISNEEIGAKLDSQQKDIDSLKKSFTSLEDAEQTKDVINARRRLLRFNDELLRKEDHSKEYFDDILNDVKIYEFYCRDHPEFPNGKADMAVENIERCYRICVEKNSFLK